MNSEQKKKMSESIVWIWLLVTTLLSGYGILKPIDIETALNYSNLMRSLQYELNSSFYPMQKPSSYIISKVGSYYCMQNGTTAKLDKYSTNASRIINWALGNLTSGGTVFLKDGDYTIDTRLLIKYNNTALCGSGRSTRLLQQVNTNLTGGLIKLEPTGYIEGITIANMLLDGNYPDQTSTQIINDEVNNGIFSNQKVKRSRYENLWFQNIASEGIYVGYGVVAGVLGGENDKVILNNLFFKDMPYQAIELNSATSITIDGVLAENCSYIGAGDGSTAVIPIYSSADISLSNINIQTANSTGILIKQSQDIHLNNILINNSKFSGLGICGSSRVEVNNLDVIDVALGTRALSVSLRYPDPLASFNCTFSNIHIRSTQDDYQFQISNSYNIILTNYLFERYTTATTSQAITLYNASNCIISNGIIECNYLGRGIHLESGSENNTIMGNIIHNSLVLGIKTETNCVGNLIANNQVDSNMLFAYGYTDTVINNKGFNPCGVIATPVTGTYLADSGAGAIANNTLYACAQSPKNIYITGGTVSIVQVEGTTVFVATNCMVHLEPSDTFKIVWSAPPTIVVIGE